MVGMAGGGMIGIAWYSSSDEWQDRLVNCSTTATVTGDYGNNQLVGYYAVYGGGTN